MRRQARVHTSRGWKVPCFERVVPGRGVGYCVIIRRKDGIGDGGCVGFEERQGTSLGS